MYTNISGWPLGTLVLIPGVDHSSRSDLLQLMSNFLDSHALVVVLGLIFDFVCVSYRSKCLSRGIANIFSFCFTNYRFSTVHLQGRSPGAMDVP